MKNLRRLSAAVAVAVALGVSVAGCVSTDVPSESTKHLGKTAATSEKVLFTDLTFESPLDDTSKGGPQLVDPFASSPDWDLVAPKDEAGVWVYASSNGKCDAQFGQVSLEPGTTVVPGDDLATTDNLLATVLSGKPAAATEKTADGSLHYGLSEYNLSVSTRINWRTDVDGAQRLTSARAFTETGTGIFLSTSCEEGTGPADIWSDVLTNITVKP